VKFEFEPEKSWSARHEQGIDSDESHLPWDHPDLMEISVKTADEPGFPVR
jgi:uncharacterized DUF497 family protein